MAAMNKNSLPSYDVIIIGSGSIGAPSALSLAQAGFRTLVVDSRASTGQGSNKAAIGGVRATHSDPAKVRLCLRSLEIFSGWQDRYGDDIEWHKGGYLFVAYREKEEQTLKNLLAVQHTLGLNIHWLDRDDMLEVVPDLNPDGLIGGTYSPDDGNLSPLLVSHAFYRHAIEYGAEFHFCETVTNLVLKGRRITGVQTDKGYYPCEAVLLAAGAWAGPLAEQVGMPLPVKPDSHEAAITEPAARFLDPMVVDIRPVAGSSNYYFYQHSTGQIVFCITPNPNIWGYECCETSSFLPMVAQRMVNLMPRLANLRVRRTWRGLYPMTPDGFPIIGWSQEVQGLLVAVGMCGQGLMLGPGVAELVTRMIQNDLTTSDHEILEILSPYREFVGQEKLK
jgi:sarcosine oxidase subunit beta